MNGCGAPIGDSYADDEGSAKPTHAPAPWTPSPPARGLAVCCGARQKDNNATGCKKPEILASAVPTLYNPRVGFSLGWAED